MRAANSFAVSSSARGTLGLSAVTATALGFGWLAADARTRADQEEAAKISAEAARDRAFDDLRVEAERSQAEALLRQADLAMYARKRPLARPPG